MAHFAQLDDNNTVTQVIVVNNNELLDNGVESETKGIQFCQSLFGGSWVQTSYNATFRKNFASVGSIYDKNLDAFFPPKPFPSWIRDDEKYDWKAPVPKPDSGIWGWDEYSLSWKEQ